MTHHDTLAVPGKVLECKNDGKGAQRYGLSNEYTFLCEGTVLKMKFTKYDPRITFSITDKAGNWYSDSPNPYDWEKPVHTETCTDTTITKTTVYQIKTGGSTPLRFVFTTVTETNLVPFTPTF